MTRPRKRMTEVMAEREARRRQLALLEAVTQRLTQRSATGLPRRRSAPAPWDDDD